MPALDPHARIDVLDTRLTAVEEWMEDFKIQMTDVGNEVRANTALTEQIHGKSEEMYEIFDATRQGFRMIQSVGSFGMKCVEVGGKLAKPLFFMGALTAGLVAYFKTGSFTFPAWWK